MTDAQCDEPGSLSTSDRRHRHRQHGYLDGGETWTYTLHVHRPAGHSNGEEDPILNTATADGDDVDDDALHQATSNTTSVDIAHDAGTLTITKSADVAAVGHGGTITYTFARRPTRPGADGSPADGGR